MDGSGRPKQNEDDAKYGNSVVAMKEMDDMMEDESEDEARSVAVRSPKSDQSDARMSIARFTKQGHRI